MHTWKLKNAQHRLRELVRLALTKEPQRLSNGKDAVVVIAASEYDRLLGVSAKRASQAMPAAAGERRTRPSFLARIKNLRDGGSVAKREPDVPAERRDAPVHSAQRPAPGEPGSDRQWVWEWDEGAQRWALPWEKDLAPGEYPGLEFMNFMQNSPLADALRTGEISEEEWDAAMRRNDQ
ncbi:hypothetical protein [Longimicrobium sp.]|jgi:hypothetical protein|uniref:hypothetical protein n=1 Tax=Longimicrobium sp. TaxID=2029185 RepID=UPI002ED8808E